MQNYIWRCAASKVKATDTLCNQYRETPLFHDFQLFPCFSTFLFFNPLSSLFVCLLYMTTESMCSNHNIAKCTPQLAHYILFVAMFCLLHSVTDELNYKKLLCNESRSLRTTKPVGSYPKSMPFIASDRNWKTKEDKGYLKLAKRHLPGQSNIEQ